VRLRSAAGYVAVSLNDDHEGRVRHDTVNATS
jgi:hypothetical protein